MVCRLTDSYNILSDSRRKALYDENNLLLDPYIDEQDMIYHDQIFPSDVMLLMDRLPDLRRRQIDVTFVAIVVSFLIVFETLLFIFTTGDARFLAFILNAVILIAVASVELIRWNRTSGDRLYDADVLWNQFFYDPHGLKEEIRRKEFSQWTRHDFEYYVLFHQLSYDQYQKEGHPLDLAAFEEFRTHVQNQLHHLEIERLQDTLSNRAIDKAYKTYAHFHKLLEDPDKEYKLWYYVSEEELKYLSQSYKAEDQKAICNLLYRLYYYISTKDYI